MYLYCGMGCKNEYVVGMQRYFDDLSACASFYVLNKHETQYNKHLPTTNLLLFPSRHKKHEQNIDTWQLDGRIKTQFSVKRICMYVRW